MGTAAENYLRHLAKQTVDPIEPDDLEPEPLRLPAVAHAFVVVGLVGVAETEEILQTASKALRARGLPGAQVHLTQAARDYSQLRGRTPDLLSWLPGSVAAGPWRLDAGPAELCIEWVKLSETGIRFQVEARTTGPGRPERHAGLVLAEVSLADDAGRSYQLYWDRGGGDRTLWVGDVLALPGATAELTWLELQVTGSSARCRIDLPSPRTVKVGRVPSRWATDAEAYLALLCASDPPAEIGRSRGRVIAAAVAEAMLLAGAIPGDSLLLRELLGRVKRSWHPVLPTTWPNPVRRATPPERRISVCTQLPFSHAAIVIEGISAWGEDVQVHLYGWPWMHVDTWPTIIPSFTVRALDDLGGEHEGRLGGWQDYGAFEARGDFTLWPAVPRSVRTLHLVVSTLSEAVSVDIDLPPADNWPDEPV